MPAPQSPQSPGHSIREGVETIVFVTVLVLMLRSFVAEAFVIPTGSMAETLLGYRKFVTCHDCGFTFPVNATDEVEPQHGNIQPVEACTCPNCFYHEVWPQGEGAPSWGSGDRVLVSKSPFHGYLRWDVVVFKYPREPQKGYVPQNYIKRLIGLPGETIAIFNGDLYLATEPIDYPPDQFTPSLKAVDRWEPSNMFLNAAPALEAFRMGHFKILRKPPAEILSMRRIVFDNDHQPTQLRGVVPPRWQGDGWKPTQENQPTEFTANSTGTDEHWLRYRHLVAEHGPGRAAPHQPVTPDFIRNMSGYNMGEPGRAGGREEENKFWVGDLILECTVDVGAKGEFLMELSKGSDRFQARFNLEKGECRLVRRGPVSSDELAHKPVKWDAAKPHGIRFANVDDQLTVWIDDELTFGDGVGYDEDSSGRRSEPHEVNDREPASIGVVGNATVKVSHIKLYRDTYYTGMVNNGFVAQETKVATRYVQPGHFLCLGDNSTQSSDGRDWGLVPERLMLGRAKMVYFPFPPFGDRVGPIR
ncbi:MAG: S26 family signal peptidase [Gemmataceae bacterium]